MIGSRDGCVVVHLAPAVADVADVARAMDGVVGVALGGSRATGTADPHSDWDLGVYYRGTPDLAPLARFGEVHPPGAWGRIMNGGAWLRHRDVRVDVVLRDVDAVEHWTSMAVDGIYEVDGLLGYLAGIPTYTLAGELAGNVLLDGRMPPAVGFPQALAATAVERWRFSAWFSIEHARMRARRGDAVGTLGQLGRATLEAAHAIMCARRAWVLNEKHLIERAGLDDVNGLVTGVAANPADLTACVDAVRASLAQAAAV